MAATALVLATLPASAKALTSQGVSTTAGKGRVEEDGDYRRPKDATADATSVLVPHALETLSARSSALLPARPG